MTSEKEKIKDVLNTVGLSIDQINDWIALTDKKGKALYANAAVEKISGYSKQEIIGNGLNIFKSHIMPDETYRQLWERILKGESYNCVFANRHKDGSIYYVANSIYPIKNETGKIKYFLSIGKEMNADGELTKQIHESMHYDKLTGLLNRNSFIENLSNMKWAYANMAVVVIKIRRLSIINKNYSFRSGEYTIKEVSDRIKKVLDEEMVFSRIEGNVLAILMTDYGNSYHIVRLINKIENSFKTPIRIENEDIYLSFSFGIATHHKENGKPDGDSLLADAQIALSQVRKNGSLERYEFYSTSLNEEVQDKIAIEKEVYEAFRNDRFVSYYQPVVDIETGRIIGLEALMRCEKGDEVISPLRFMNTLEETGLISEVGYRLVQKISRQIKEWMKEYGGSLPVSINLSPVQFKNEYFCGKILDVISDEGIPAELITFEITESTLIENINRTMEILNEMRSRGFNVAIDDFGTGYSSLSYIQKFNINSLKIDMSFIKNIASNSGDQTIVNAVIMMAKGLNINTVAEGIETKEQLEVLKALGCNKGQGYYWSKPVKGSEISKIYEDKWP